MTLDLGQAADLEAWRNERQYGTPSTGARTDGQRDADRILYSTAFRRLGGVTQVVSVNEPTLVHNRLTHSLKVAQIGQRLAQSLLKSTSPEAIIAGRGLDPDVVYAACLAHDLGHPPFGHVAENELQLVLRNLEAYSDVPKHEPAGGSARVSDTFEGNAQSLRIVAKLAWQSDDEQGLNLSRATLNAIMKYPWQCGQGPKGAASAKWSAYDSEAAGQHSVFAFARDGLADHRKTVEAQIMDWADDIAYAVHDVEDFFRAGLVPLDRIAVDPEEAQHFLSHAIKVVDVDPAVAHKAFDAVRQDHFVKKPYRGTKDDQIALTRMSSFLIDRYVKAARIEGNGTLFVHPTQRCEVDLLKQLTWIYTIDNPALGSLQHGQRHIVRTLFNLLNLWVEKIEGSAQRREQLPVQLWDYVTATRFDEGAREAYSQDDTALRARGIVDYISGLTEVQATDLYERMTGASVGSALSTWLTTS